MYRLKIIFLSFLFLFTAVITKTQSQVLLSEGSKVSVLTCGTGNEMYSLFGHTAIRIMDDENHIDQVYNYGTFDFNTSNFVLKFTKGDLQYMASSNTYNDFFNEYLYEKRAVYEQILNLSSPQKQDLFDRLDRALLSDERYYTYKFIDKNCTTMVVDILNETLGKKVIVKTADTEKTYREILYPYFADHFFEKLGTSIIFGKKVDQKGTLLFLPLELKQSLNTIKYNNQPISSPEKTILEFQKEEAPYSWWNNMYTYLLILSAIVIVNNKKVYISYFFLLGLLGLFLFIVGFYSFHKELEYNYNILLFNPAFMLLTYFYLKNRRTGMYYTALFSIISLAVYFLLLMNKVHLLIALPIIVVNSIGLIRLIIQNRNQAAA
ncbi:DUF4105 domain-containing protein [Flavobacterium sp. GT3R68]|uniref:lipoprotein N-acyltransferase Lnb domain-containing protein n=1 Tax=Flavobacterium sp. GT3R68 TaxID=2594437 RepID=UPI0021035416|nr:DUF4105 domain-containing protein [Flavobacterium sp. GT3R68]